MYNSVKELHIGIDLGLQRLNINTKQVIKPEEKDWVLNETMYQLINQVSNANSRISKDYAENDQKAIDMLESIKVTNGVVLPVLSNKSSVLPNEAFTFLPKDYLRMIKVRALITRTANVDETYSNRINKFVLHINDVAANEYTDRFSITYNTNTLFDIEETLNGDDVYNFADFNNVESKYMAINAAIQHLNTLVGVSAYYSKFDGNYSPESIVMSVDIEKFNSVDGNTNVANDTTMFLFLGQDTPRTINAVEVDDYTTDAESITAITKCRVITSADEDNINDHYFAKSKHTSPTVTVGDGLLKVNVPDGYTIRALVPEYYRRPIPISTPLRQGCEIQSADFNNELVNKAVQKISARIEDKAYPQLITENMLLE